MGKEANVFDLKTQYESITANTSLTTHIGGRIPAGKTRFLTYIKIERGSQTVVETEVTGISALIGSVAYSNATGLEMSVGALLGITLQTIAMSDESGVRNVPNGVFVRELPKNPGIDKPLLSVVGGASSWMGLCVYGADGPAGRVFAEYFDA